MSKHKPDYNKKIKEALDKMDRLDKILEVEAFEVGVRAYSDIYGESIADPMLVEKVRDVFKDYRVELAEEIKELMKKAINDG